MNFLHPEILLGLFAIAIPIIVHLFQLRKFKSEPFTNVALLKKLVISSRKSSKLKKWLSLISRILIITCLVLAFAQPFIPSSDFQNNAREINIFLDNSYSMSLKGENTSLFTQAKEELLEHLPNDQTYNLITHNDVYRNLNAEDLKSVLFDVNYYSDPIALQQILQKTESVFSNAGAKQKEMIILSDFQLFITDDNALNYSPDIAYHFVNYKPQSLLNFSVDTASFQSSVDERLLNFKISASEAVSQNIPVSIDDGKKLLGKLSLKFDKETSKTYSFNLEAEEYEKGRIEIEDAGLTYDNTLYFSITKPETISVLVVSEQITNYFDRIYDNDRFDYKQVSIQQLEFEDISQADVVILNEIESLSNALNISVKNYADKNGVLVIIPAKKANLNNYNKLFNALGLETYSGLTESSIKLTNINLDHPIFKNVFTENVNNFDYPTFESYYPHFTAQNALSFSNDLSFLESQSNIYRFNAAIADNSNFTQSPLVVLSFYNMALSAQSKENLYLNTGDVYEVKLKDNLQQDQVLELSQGQFSFIPRQKTEGQNVVINFENYPENPGHFKLLKTNTQDTLRTLAFNSSRKESHIKYYNFQKAKNVNQYLDFKSYSQAYFETTETKTLWQWFVALALIFMIIELLLLRFIK